MPTIRLYEAERGFIDYTLNYSSAWSVVGKRGMPLLRTDISVVYFYIRNAAGTTIISLTDASSSQIEWISATLGKIRVKLGTNTLNNVAANHTYELRLKMSDASWITVDYGTLEVIDSVVNTP